MFFVQVRIGRDARPFRMLKIRTMHPDVVGPAGATLVSWTYCGDPRITSIGRWLRRWRLDEIPQFLNVLSGSMSLVGPRPETREATEYLQARIPNYRRRLIVRPGVTGLCQVSSAYLHFTTLDEISQKVRLDLRYVEAVSARTDAYILLRTIVVLLRGQGIS